MRERQRDCKEPPRKIRKNLNRKGRVKLRRCRLSVQPASRRRHWALPSRVHVHDNGKIDPDSLHLCIGTTHPLTRAEDKESCEEKRAWQPDLEIRCYLSNAPTCSCPTLATCDKKIAKKVDDRTSFSFAVKRCIYRHRQTAGSVKFE